jgi:hypothetical protein
MSGSTFTEGLCTLQVIHHGIPQPSMTSGDREATLRKPLSPDHR